MHEPPGRLVEEPVPDQGAHLKEQGPVALTGEEVLVEEQPDHGRRDEPTHADDIQRVAGAEEGHAEQGMLEAEA